MLDTQSIGSKSAAAAAHVTPTSMGTAASAGDPLNPDSTFSGAVSFALLYSSAYLAVAAVGSLAEGTEDGYRALYAGAGLDAYGDGALSRLRRRPV